jgi:uncharacterized protein
MMDERNKPGGSAPSNDRVGHSPLYKCFLTLVGVLSVGLAILGVFLPLLPTTPFLLLAVACFLRSSDRLYRWLINQRYLGPYIRNYREHRAITLPTKIVTLLLLWGAIIYAAFGVIEMLLIRALLLLIAVSVTAHVLSLKTLTDEMLSRSAVAEEAKEVKDGEQDIVDR